MRRVLMLVVLVGVASVAGIGSAKAITPSSDPGLCVHGGWHALESESGGSFSNQGECVSYAQHGGLLYEPSLSLIPRCFSAGDVEVEITASGFHPSSVATVDLHGDTFLFSGSTELTLTTGDPNTKSGIPGGFKIQPVLTPPLYADSVITVAVHDAQGVHASASTAFFCAPPR